jgi:hypothetical protein
MLSAKIASLLIPDLQGLPRPRYHGEQYASILSPCFPDHVILQTSPVADNDLKKENLHSVHVLIMKSEQLQCVRDMWNAAKCYMLYVVCHDAAIMNSRFH